MVVFALLGGINTGNVFFQHIPNLQFYTDKSKCDTLHDLVPFVQSKNVKNTHGGVSLLVKFLQIFVKTWKTPMEECFF